MKTRWAWTLRAGLVGAWSMMAMTASAQPREAPKDAAATIGDETISMADLERSASTELANVEQQRYRLLDQKLAQLIADRLIAREAQRRGVSVDALLQTEVSSKAIAVTTDDVNSFIAQNRARLPQGNEADLRVRVADYLQRTQVNHRREAYVATLREQTPVQVHLKPPEPVRVKIDQGVGFARGPREAPVTVVEFSDFQCPFCKTVVSTLKQVAAQYSDRVRWVFRDFPLAALHPAAPLAHEAARCAGDQDKFWGYHDLLFERAPEMSAAALREYAVQLDMNATAFNQCLDSRKHRAAVSADMEAGAKLGVTGTPTFFINGQLLVGNQPLAEFQRIIERELTRAAAAR